MNITRVMFVASYRIGNATLSLNFDHNLLNINQTYIITDFDLDRIDAIFQKYGIDTTNFNYIHDNELINQYPSVNHWLVPNDPRNKWLFQQAIKLAAIDYINSDVILLQDADTFVCKPYSCVENGKPNIFVVDHYDHPVYGPGHGYYDTLKNLTGITPQAKQSFVSELFPVFKEDWYTLRRLIKEDFLQDIFNSITLSKSDNLLWFSEYEFLGNWTLHCRSIAETQQIRFEYKNVNNLNQDLSKYNSICNITTDCFSVDFSNDSIPEFDLGRSLILHNL